MRMKKTSETRMVEAALKEHFPNYPPDYPPTAYRTDSTSIHVRIVDRSFERIPWMDRYDVVLPVLHMLPKKTQRDITLLVLFAPDEVEGSGLNHQFENPSPPPRFHARSRNGIKTASSRKTRTSRGARS